MIALFSALRTLKRQGTKSFYPTTRGSEELTLVCFADTSYTKGTSQFCFIVELVVGPVKFGFLFQLLLGFLIVLE